MNFQHLKKKLRSQHTWTEKRLWYFLRDRRLQGYKFRRQVQIGPYIVDFVCHEKSLIVECDGSQHGAVQARQYDAKRTEYLQSQGYQVLRFWDNEVFTNIDGVLFKILAH